MYEPSRFLELAKIYIQGLTFGILNGYSTHLGG